MKIFAHRGNSEKYSDNTIPSIRSALTQGFSVEVDLRVSADGTFVINHDPSIHNESDKYYIDKLILEEIKEIKSEKYGVRLLPTLEEMIDIFVKHSKKSTKIALHLKDYNRDRVEERLVEQINRIQKKYTNINLLDRLFVFDVLLENAEHFKAIEPRLKIGLSVGESEIYKLDKYPTIYNLDVIQRAKNYDIIWADEWIGGLYNKEFVSQYKSKEKQVFLVSPELHSDTNPSHPKRNEYVSYWKSMCSLNIDGICTDYPNQLRKIYQ